MIRFCGLADYVACPLCLATHYDLAVFADGAGPYAHCPNTDAPTRIDIPRTLASVLLPGSPPSPTRIDIPRTVAADTADGHDEWRALRSGRQNGQAS